MQYIVAGTGYSGSRVLASLPKENAIGLSRSAVTSTGGHRVLQADLDADSRPDLAPDGDYVLLYTVPPAAASPDSRLARLLEMLQPAPLRVVYLSTSGVYGNCDGRLTDESATVRPRTARARRRAAAEEMLRQWCSSNSCEVTVLRVPAIYGPGRLGLERIRTAMPVIADEDAPPGNRIHVDDLVECCIAALNCAKPAGVYNVGDGDFRTAGWFARTVARLSGLPPRPEISMQQALQTFSAQRLSFLRESRRLDNARMRELLGIGPRDPETGIRQSLA